MAARSLTSNLTGPGNRFLKAFGGANTQPLSGVQSHSQGINYALQELLSGIGIGEDRKEREAFMEAIQAAQVADPSTITAPMQEPEAYLDAEEGGAIADGATDRQIANPNQRSLSQRLTEGMTGLGGNSYARQFQTNMLPQMMARAQALGDRDDNRAYAADVLKGNRVHAAGLASTARTQKLGDADLAHTRAIEIAKSKLTKKPPDLVRQYNFAMSQTPPGQQMSFDNWKVRQSMANQGVLWQPPPLTAPGPSVGSGAPIPTNAGLVPSGGGMGVPIQTPPQNLPTPAGRQPLGGPPQTPPQNLPTPAGGQTLLVPGSRAAVSQAAVAAAEEKARIDRAEFDRAVKNDMDKKFAKGNKTRLREGNMLRAGGTVVGDLGRLRHIVDGNWMATGLPSALTRWFPAGFNPSFAAEKMKESIASNTGVNELMQMKAASETGGGVGQVPVQQQVKFEQLLGSLDLSQNKDVVVDNINRMSNLWLDMLHGTPEEIQRRVGVIRKDRVRPDGTRYPVLTQEKADNLKIRQRLSFDDMGNPIKRDPGEYTRKGKPVTEDDIKRTMRDTGMDRAEIFRMLERQKGRE